MLEAKLLCSSPLVRVISPALVEAFSSYAMSFDVLRRLNLNLSFLVTSKRSRALMSKKLKSSFDGRFSLNDRFSLHSGYQ
ncbi:MAG: hypothetical protein AAFN93_00515, partial [Bacteroidota bacterium]